MPRTSATRACSWPTPAPCHATDDGGRSASHHHDPVREIGHTTAHYAATERTTPVEHGDTFFTIDDRDTLFFQSISDNDVTVTDDHSVNTVTAIQDNDVNVSDDDVTIDADGSFNSDNDVVAIQDNDVNGGDSPIDVDVTGGVTPGAGPAAAPTPRPPTRPTSRPTTRPPSPGPPRSTRSRSPRPPPTSRRTTPSTTRWTTRSTTRRTTPTPCRCEVAMTSDPVAVVERARAAIARYDRPDLDERLAATRARLLDDRTRVLVVGEFKQGKSMLVNGLVGAPVCPTFDDVATAVPTVVRHAEAVDVALVRGPTASATTDHRATSSPTTSASRATRATARAGATPRSGCPAPS